MKRFLAFALAACSAGLFIISGCSPKWVRSTVVREQNMMVSLEKRAGKAGPALGGFRHPYDIDKEKLGDFLSGLHYLDEPWIYGTKAQPRVFSEKEIQRLVPAVEKALQEAGPAQRVRFVSYNIGGRKFFKKKRRTSGVVFIDEKGRLNAAFSDVNYALKNERLEESFKNQGLTDPMRIRSYDRPVLVPHFAVHKQIEPGVKMPLWVLADIEKIGTPAPEEYKAGAAESAEYPEFRETPEKQQREEKPVPAVKEEPEPRPGAQTASQKPLDKDAGEARKPAGKERYRKQGIRGIGPETRIKLQYLGELYESGVINEREYRVQKSRLLENIQ